MIDLPAPGTRVSLRYLLPAGSLPPHPHVVGHVVAAAPKVAMALGYDTDDAFEPHSAG